MKNIIFVFFPLICFGQVGVFTNTPEEVLHIDGITSEVMIDGLNKTNNPLNLGSDANTRVFANADGDLVLGERDDNFLLIMDNANYIPDDREKQVPQTGTGENFTHLDHNSVTFPSFILDGEAIIEINYSLSWRIRRNNSTKISDNGARVVKTTVFIFNNRTGAYLPDTYALCGQFYSNGDIEKGADKGFYNTGSDYVLLPAGEYTIVFGGLVQAAGNDNILAYFGGENDQLQIIAHY